ncbi:hypothetical protein E2C01_081677 [Portunus trituberculatus]|uniref:Uncharacterized protein n=1 Tax=Portunus trituberculatus TaxID=210409 RepID=A0A5B7IN26_PORTR|nr:hypothetical protein [Portunus trituberculatus]
MEGYKKAWELLETRHGNKRTYIQHLMKGVCRGPSVRMNDIKGLRLFTDALNTCVRDLKVMGELKQIETYESMRVITRRFKGKLRDDYVDESHRHEELDSATSCDAEWLLTFTKNMLRKAEKDREQIEEPSGQHANPSCKSLPTQKTMELMTAASKVTDSSLTQSALCVRNVITSKHVGASLI